MDRDPSPSAADASKEATADLAARDCVPCKGGVPPLHGAITPT